MNFNKTGMRLTDCCSAYSTFMGSDLSCRACCKSVKIGEGDGNDGIENHPELREEWTFAEACSNG